jgi:hypothetical protein
MCIVGLIDGEALVVELQEDQSMRVKRRIIGHRKRVTGVWVDPVKILTGSEDGTVKVGGTAMPEADYVCQEAP